MKKQTAALGLSLMLAVSGILGGCSGSSENAKAPETSAEASRTQVKLNRGNPLNRKMPVRGKL